jgi:flagellar hook-basal body complex protein FliE
MKLSPLQIQPLNPEDITAGSKNSSHVLPNSQNTFSTTLKNAMDDVNNLQMEAGAAIEKMVAGEDVDMHEVMIAVEKAKTSFDLLMEVRNKTLEAYRELIRMQV